MTKDPPPDDKQVKNALAMHRHAVGLALATERFLESIGHPVESAIVTREKRRNLTRRTRKRNI